MIVNLSAAIADDAPHTFEHFIEAKKALELPNVRTALLAEYAFLSQQKAEMPFAVVDQEMLQQIAFLDGKRELILQLLRGEFRAQEAQEFNQGGDAATHAGEVR